MFKCLFHTLNSIVILHYFLFPTFQAMTSHVANVIYTVLCSSWHEDYVTLHFSLCFLITSLFFEHLGPLHFYVTFIFSYPCCLTHSDRNTKIDLFAMEGVPKPLPEAKTRSHPQPLKTPEPLSLSDSPAARSQHSSVLWWSHGNRLQEHSKWSPRDLEKTLPEHELLESEVSP